MSYNNNNNNKVKYCFNENKKRIINRFFNSTSFDMPYQHIIAHNSYYTLNFIEYKYFNDHFRKIIENKNEFIYNWKS